ncbi:MAG: hypothetical protein ACE5PV_08585 [Candidatus Poribacteria bacterium]
MKFRIRFSAKSFFFALAVLFLFSLFVVFTLAEVGEKTDKQPGGYRLGKEITLLSAEEADKMKTAKTEPGGLLNLDDKLYLGPSLEQTKPIPISGKFDPMSGKAYVLPDEIVQYIPPEIYKTLKAVKSISPEEIGSFKALKSDDPNWNKSVVYFISKEASILISLTGPTTLIVVSLLDIPVNESGLKKYNVTMMEKDEDIGEAIFNTPKMKKVVSSKPSNLQCGIPGIFTFPVPKGEHNYKFDLVSSEAGDVGMRFFVPE